MKPSIWLTPLAIPYQAAVQARNRFYDWGVFPVFPADAPVISVGNIAVGGTGKTPTVIYLAQRLKKIPQTTRLKTAVVSRGYKGSATGTVVVSNGRKTIAIPEIAGDEPILIADSCPGCVVIVDRDRIRGAQYAISEYKAGIILLDDGFQHRRLKRNLDIVLLNASNPLGNRLVLPAGFLREPVSSLKRADVIVLSKARGNAEDLASRAEKMEQLLNKPVIVTELTADYLKRIGKNEIISVDQTGPQKVMAFAGIASPRDFFATLENNGANIVKKIALPDHCRYTKFQMDYIARSFVQSKAELMITTAKDAVKLPSILRFLPVYQLESHINVVYGEEKLDKAIIKSLNIQKDLD